jgi:hypothetical protein
MRRSMKPTPWIVERTFAWLANYRRLDRDYEISPRTSEAWIKIAMIHLMVRSILRQVLRDHVTSPPEASNFVVQLSIFGRGGRESSPSD